MSDVYEYRTAGRRPLTRRALAAMCVVPAIAAYAHAPFTVWAVWLGLTGVLGFHVLVNPTTGARLDDQALTIRQSGRETRIPLNEIAAIELDTRTGARPRAAVQLTNGKTLALPADCLPPPDTLTALCDRHGLPVRTL